MKKKISVGSKVFDIFNHTFLIASALLCVLPMVHILAISFSSSSAASGGLVKLWPVDFTLKSYMYVFEREAFWKSIIVSFKRIILGGIINLLLTILTAYPLSKKTESFKFRTFYVWVFFITMLFGGGLIPYYMVIKYTGLIDTIWALIIPGAVPVFNVILLLNFFREVPDDLEEAALLDGAGDWTILWRIYVPVSLASLATITLFTVVGHWNSWFDGLIFMNRPENYPLQSYLQTVIAQRDLKTVGSEWKTLSQISDRTVKCAQIFLGALPILSVYPFLQKYFVKGMTLGSVKG